MAIQLIILLKNLAYNSSFNLDRAFKFVNSHGLTQASVPKELADFIEKLINEDEITQADLERMHNLMENIAVANPRLYDAVIGIYSHIAENANIKYKDDIASFHQQIENQLNIDGQLFFFPQNNLAKYRGLLNAYLISKDEKLKLKGVDYPGNEFPYSTNLFIDDKNLIFNLSFDINTLLLCKQFPQDQQYAGMVLKDPIYPEENSMAKVPLKRGIKDSSTYFPYKRVNKLFIGDQLTYLATNGKKILYIRGNRSRHQFGANSNSIFASKIASFVSKENFSSERMLDRQVEGSRKLKNYMLSVGDIRVINDIKNYLENDKRVFPGIGTIDEVLNFVVEIDSNKENFGLSSTKMSEAIISKIDFDRCDVGRAIPRNKYETNILRSLYSRTAHVQKDPIYIHEKLRARLKLCIMSDKLLGAIAEKAYLDPQIKLEVLKVVIERTDIALALLLEHKDTKSFLEENPTILEDLHKETTQYIRDHFDDSLTIIQSVENRINKVRSQLVVKQLADGRSQPSSKRVKLFSPEQAIIPDVVKHPVEGPQPSSKRLKL